VRFSSEKKHKNAISVAGKPAAGLISRGWEREGIERGTRNAKKREGKRRDKGYPSVKF